MREFEGGALRDDNHDKINPEAALSPIVLERFCVYMREKSYLPDGSRRTDDNWAKGIPLDSYMESMARHFFSVWKNHRNWKDKEDLETALCALFFNVQGYLYEVLKEKQQVPPTQKPPLP